MQHSTCLRSILLVNRMFVYASTCICISTGLTCNIFHSGEGQALSCNVVVVKAERVFEIADMYEMCRLVLSPPVLEVRDLMLIAMPVLF